jgi:hypothetical protein
MIYDNIKKQYIKGKGVRLIILKARQQGASTLVSGIIFTQTVTNENINSAVVAHDAESTSKLFDMYKLFYDQLSDDLKPTLKANNAKILEFDKEQGGLKSSIRCLTAGTKTVGRSATIHKLHASEFAFWQGSILDTWSGLIQAVPNTPESVVVIESTANGFNEFQELWEKAVNGENDFFPLFIPWTALDEYRIKDSSFEPKEDERILAKQFNLDNEQLAWRRWCIKNNCMNDLNKFKQEYPITAEEAFISTGECYFDLQAIIDRATRLKETPPLSQGYFEYDKVCDRFGNVTLNNIKWQDAPNGYIKIYMPPEKNVCYSIGGDTAGEGNDHYTAEVIDCNNLAQMAELNKQKMDEDTYSEQCVCLAKYYNEALIAIETNFNAYIVHLIAKLGYTRQYVAENPTDAQYTKFSDKFGFKTTVASRPVILSEFKIIFNQNTGVINSKELLAEMRTFVLSESGRRYEAMIGKHDDRVMAMAIAYFCRHQANTPNGMFKL